MLVWLKHGRLVYYTFNISSVFSSLQKIFLCNTSLAVKEDRRHVRVRHIKLSCSTTESFKSEGGCRESKKKQAIRMTRQNGREKQSEMKAYMSSMQQQPSHAIYSIKRRIAEDSVCSLACVGACGKLTVSKTA